MLFRSVDPTDAGQAVPTISDNYLDAPRRTYRRRKVTIGELPFATVYQPVPEALPAPTRPCLEDVLVHIGHTRNCVSFVRDGSDPLFAETSDRLAIYGRQSISPITINHQGSDNYSVNLEFTEEV